MSKRTYFAAGRVCSVTSKLCKGLWLDRVSNLEERYSVHLAMRFRPFPRRYSVTPVFFVYLKQGKRSGLLNHHDQK